MRKGSREKKREDSRTVNNSIRKALPRMTWMMVLFLIILILPTNIFIQYEMQHQSQEENSYEVFGQLRQLVEINQKDLEQAKEEYKQKCIQSAEMAAYFVENYPSVTSDFAQTVELAEKLDVDELHFFTPEGEIYFGTLPQYYGYTFESGEQMEFFAPMLKDKDLQLCQDIMPNTAEGKEMQYAAVWLKDGSGIVQIGMEPKRLLQEMEEKSLTKLIEAIPVDLHGYLHVVEKNSNTVIASTQKDLIGFSLDSEEWNGGGEEGEIRVSHRSFRGRRFCVYTQDYGDYVFVRTYASVYPLKDMIISTIFVLLYIAFAGTIVISLIAWYVNRKLYRNLMAIVDELGQIERGNLESIALKTGILEFDELLFYINQLLKSIRLNWDKLSYVIDKGRLPIGIFEYNSFYKKIFVSEQLLSILGIEEAGENTSDEIVGRVRQALESVEKNIESPDNPICEYDRNGNTIYLRIEKETDEHSVTYYVTDVSLWWSELHTLREQSNRDTLTGLYNRRGFSEKMEQLFTASKPMGYGVMLFLDSDGLKKINDLYGHRAGDLYLCRIAESVLESFGEKAICARLGGDEFAVFQHGYSTVSEAEQAADKLKKKRGAAFESEEPKIRETIEFSMGCAFYPMDGKDYRLLMHIADENMYQEKRIRKHVT